MEGLKTLIRDVITRYPDLKDKVIDLYYLCVSEIEEGSSMEQEINMCERDIEELIRKRTTAVD